jgi:hypothetical protein
MMPLPGQLSLLDGPELDAEPLPVCAPASGRDDVRTSYRGAYWRAWTPGTTEADARRCFKARFGVEPATVTTGLGGIVMAGPIVGVRR